MTCLIVEDNAMARVALRNLVEDLGQIEIVAECEDALTALRILRERRVDFLLLDVELPKMSGLEMVEALPHPPQVILITSKAEYAVDAFRLEIVDYLIKPVQFARLTQAIERVREKLKARSLAAPAVTVADDYLFVKTNHGLQRINQRDIRYLQAMGDYVNLVTADRRFPILGRLKDLLQRMPEGRFVRSHRSYAINLDHLERIEDGAAIIGKDSVPISDSYRAEVYARLKML